MDNQLIITIGIVLIVGIAYGVKIFIQNKKNNTSDIDLEDILEQYVEQIIETGAKIISTLQINRDEYASEDEYNLALAGHAAIEVKKLITDSEEIPDYIRDMLTVEVITQFILRVFDINRGLLDEAVQEQSELFKAKFINSIQTEEKPTIFTDVEEECEDKQTNITEQLNDFYEE